MMKETEIAYIIYFLTTNQGRRLNVSYVVLWCYAKMQYTLHVTRVHAICHVLSYVIEVCGSNEKNPFYGGGRMFYGTTLKNIWPY